ncbi:MAG TPA: M13 family metallopeptidase [Ferruginibacter sp.]|nr:M13 family metallopeptidase [Ferruginibacter sp.]
MKKLFFALVIITWVISCNSSDQNTSTITASTTKPDILLANLDSTITPGADFFDYANGGWIKRNPIPNEQSSWGIGHLVVEENMKRLREISEKAAAANAAKGSNDQKIGDFWTTGMDSTKIEADGLKPIQSLLDKLNAVTDTKALMNVVTDFKKIGSNTFFADWVGQDDKNSEVMAYGLWQGGLGLPEREYYFKNDSATINIRNKYVEYISKILTMAGEDPAIAATSAKNILAMETKMATASRKIEDLRDPYKNYNKMAITDLGKMAGNIDWAAYTKNLGVTNVDSAIVGQPEFFRAMNEAVVKTPLTDLRQYVKFNLITDMAAVLPDAYGNEAFNFSKLFSGAKERKPRWKRVIEMEEAAMGEMLGQLYVKEFFNETAKKRYTVMVEDIRGALKDRIAKLDWMSDSTKQKAYIKLAAIKSKVGYPDKWKDFSAMDIGRESLAKNYMNSRLWWHNYEYSKLGKPVNRDEWTMTPQTYNAYYNPSNNEIVLPAGIFTVPGYLDAELDDAIVYGYGGNTISHEITHGFDDYGRLYDDKGNLKSWWTKTDEEAFNKRAQVMVNQFNEYEPVNGYHINGKATLGENIADLGGILLGMEAFKKTAQYKENKPISNLMPMQRYFMGYALGWLGHYREETQKARLLTDVHSPGKYRVNGPFVDIDEFYTAFNIKPGDKMYRADSLRVRIW